MGRGVKREGLKVRGRVRERARQRVVQEKSDEKGVEGVEYPLDKGNCSLKASIGNPRLQCALLIN